MADPAPDDAAAQNLDSCHLRTTEGLRQNPTMFLFLSSIVSLSCLNIGSHKKKWWKKMCRWFFLEVICSSIKFSPSFRTEWMSWRLETLKRHFPCQPVARGSPKSQEMLTELFAALPEDPYEYLSQTQLKLAEDVEMWQLGNSSSKLIAIFLTGNSPRWVVKKKSWCPAVLDGQKMSKTMGCLAEDLSPRCEATSATTTGDPQWSANGLI